MMMKLHTLKIIILNILLFNGSVVYCDVLFDPSQKKINTPNRQDPTELIKSSCSYIEISGPTQLTRRFVYEIPTSSKSKFSFPNKVNNIKFNNYTIQFDENVILPIFNIDYVSIYTSSRYFPMLILIFGDSSYHYYSFNPSSNKWNNYNIINDKAFKKHVDDDGNFYYLETIFDFSDSISDISKNTRYVNDYYSDDQSSYIDSIDYKNIEIYIRSPEVSDVSNNEPSNFIPLINDINGINSTPLTNGLFKEPYDTSLVKGTQFKVDGSIVDRLVYPNKLDKINFNDYMIEFDSNAMLPQLHVDYIYIYTCKHNNPILMYMRCKSKHYFYSLDARTNKWNNHKLKYDTRYYQYTDKNGTIYYKLSFDITSLTHEIREEIELVKQACKGSKCLRINANKGRNIQIYMKSSVGKDTNTEFPMTRQPITIRNDTIINKDVKVDQSNKSSQITSVNDTNGVTNAVYTKIITANLSFTYTNTNKQLTREFVYKIYGSLRSKLSYPNKIDKIKIGAHLIQFDENAKLPCSNVEYISIYTCQHNTPILLYFYVKSSYFYYSLNPKTNKWSNHRIQYDTGLHESLDSNGTYYYTISDDDSYNKIDKYEDKELLRYHCKKEKCNSVSISNYNNIEVFLNNPNISIISKSVTPKTQLIKSADVNKNTTSAFNLPNNPVPIGLSHETNKSIPTNLYYYKIDDSIRSTLIYPNKLDRINFNGYIIQFDENTRLPNIYVDYIYIYTCKHNTPILMYMHGDSKFYYYSMDSKSNKWINHRIKYDTGLKEFIDPKGTYFYKISLEFSPNGAYKFEDIELVKHVCNENKCARINVNKEKNIQLFMKNSNVSKSSITVAPKTPQLFKSATANKTSSSNIKYEPINGGYRQSNDSVSTNLFFYKLEEPVKSRLLFPNKLDKINFNGYMIAFDNNTILPEINIDFVYIYTCKHNNPLLLLMWGDSRSYYYSLNTKTNKWSNYKLRYDNGSNEHVDSNGVYYYTLSLSSNSATFKYEDTELVKHFCKESKCVRVNVNNDRKIDLLFK